MAHIALLDRHCPLLPVYVLRRVEKIHTFDMNLYYLIILY